MNLDSKLTKAELHTYEKLRLKWKELSIEDIILDGLYLNCVRLVKEYCDRVLKIDLKQSKIHDIGLKSVLQLLADKDLRGAEILLNNMSFDPNQKIYQICFFTLYKQLRDYLISILIDRQKLNQNELEMVKYLKKFEMVYSCRSFETAKQNVNKFK